MKAWKPRGPSALTDFCQLVSDDLQDVLTDVFMRDKVS